MSCMYYIFSNCHCWSSQWKFLIYANILGANVRLSFSPTANLRFLSLSYLGGQIWHSLLLWHLILKSTLIMMEWTLNIEINFNFCTDSKKNNPVQLLIQLMSIGTLIYPDGPHAWNCPILYLTLILSTLSKASILLCSYWES